MAEMTAKAYLKKAKEICVIEDEAGRCGQSTENTKGCPLWEFCCGVPNDNKKIDAAIEAVKNYKIIEIIEADKCPKCGRDKSALQELQGAKFCPYCGEKQAENVK